MCLDDPVAFARGGFQPLAVQDGDLLVPVINESGLVQRSGDDRDTWPANAQHDGQKLLRQIELVCASAVVGIMRGAHPTPKGSKRCELSLPASGGFV